MTLKTFIIVLMIIQIYFAYHAFQFKKKEKPKVNVQDNKTEINGQEVNAKVYSYVMKLGPQMKRHFNNVWFILFFFIIGSIAVAPNMDGYSRYGGNLTFVIPNLILFGLIISVITIIMNVLLKDYMIAGIALFNAIAMYIAYFQMNLTMNMDGFTEFFLILVLVYNTNKMIKLHSGTYPFFTWTMINHLIASTLVLLLM